MNGFGRGEEKQEKKQGIFTRETVGMTLLLFGAIIFFITVTGSLVFGEIGTAITAFFVGFTGFFLYPALILLMYFSFVLVSGKKILPFKWLMKGVLLLISVFFIVHTATAERFFGGGYGAYLSGCWDAAKTSVGAGTGGGALFGLIAYPVRFLLSAAGAYIFFALLTALSLFFIFTGTPLWQRLKNAPRKKTAEPPAQDGALSFDGLERRAPRYEESAGREPTRYEGGTIRETPRYAERTARGESDYYPAAAWGSTGKSSSQTSTPRESSRDILFMNDPAESYNTNLIFDRDSQFNRTRRNSSMTAAPSPDSSAPRAESSSYAERYASEAEDVRSSMPRKVSGAEDSEDLNYPQTPSYRAPSEWRSSVSGSYPFGGTPTYRPVPEEPKPRPGDSVPDREQPRPSRFGDSTSDREQSRPSRFGDSTSAPEQSGPSRFGDSTSDREQSGPSRFGDSAPAPEERREEPLFRPGFGSTEPPAEKAQETPIPQEDSVIFPDPIGNDPVTPDRSFIKPTEDEPLTDDTPTEGRARDFLSRSQPRFELKHGRYVGEETDAEEEEDGAMSSRENVFDRRSAADLFDEDDVDDMDEVQEEPEEPEEPAPPAPVRGERTRPLFERRRAEEKAAPSEPAPSAPAPAPKRVIRKYVYPDISNFAVYDEKSTVSDEEIERNSEIILNTLMGFGVEAVFVGARRGPTITQYNIDIPKNVAVKSVLKRGEEIAMRLRVENVNIYPNPQAEAISIEVPNAKTQTVGIRSVMESEEYRASKPGSLVFTMGKDIEGNNVCGDIFRMKHILMAGATGAGKSVSLNAMLASLITKYSPEELRLILIDPKGNEFGVYEGLPHLMINEVISEAQKAVMALKWVVKEMNRRYDLFGKMVHEGKNVRSLDEYNKNLPEEDRLPKIVVVVDELADLMLTVKKELETHLQSISQKARAAGIHLVIATQRPSVNVITGVIKANLPTRIAFRVAQEVDSRTILDEPGAEKLLGNGDMYYRTEKMQSCGRVQGVYISSEEVEALVKDIKRNNEAYFDEAALDYISSARPSGDGDLGGDDEGMPDDVYLRALAIVVELKTASISLIQRKCSVGYNHAGKIIEWMEAMGYISPFDGKAKARTVLLTKEEFEAKYGGYGE